jgi:hypothetical protein
VRGQVPDRQNRDVGFDRLSAGKVKLGTVPIHKIDDIAPHDTKATPGAVAGFGEKLLQIGAVGQPRCE